MAKSNGKAAPQPMPHEDPCYRPNKAGEISGHNAEFIRQAIRAGVLKGVRLGRRSVGVRASELKRWLAAMEAGDAGAFLPPRTKKPEDEAPARVPTPKDVIGKRRALGSMNEGPRAARLAAPEPVEAS